MPSESGSEVCLNSKKNLKTAVGKNLAAGDTNKQDGINANGSSNASDAKSSSQSKSKRSVTLNQNDFETCLKKDDSIFSYQSQSPESEKMDHNETVYNQKDKKSECEALIDRMLARQEFDKVNKWLERIPSKSSIPSSDISMVPHDSFETVMASGYLKKHNRGMVIKHNGYKMPLPSPLKTDPIDNRRKLLEGAVNQPYGEICKDFKQQELGSHSQDELKRVSIWNTGIVVGPSNLKKVNETTWLQRLKKFFFGKEPTSQVNKNQVESVLLLDDYSNEDFSSTCEDGYARNYILKEILQVDEQSENKDPLDDRSSLAKQLQSSKDEAEIERLSILLQEKVQHSAPKGHMRTIFSYRKATGTTKARENKQGFFRRIVSIWNNILYAGNRLIQMYKNSIRKNKRNDRVFPVTDESETCVTRATTASSNKYTRTPNTTVSEVIPDRLNKDVETSSTEFLISMEKENPDLEPVNDSNSKCSTNFDTLSERESEVQHSINNLHPNKTKSSSFQSDRKNEDTPNNDNTELSEPLN